jgi:hypothetical protein
VGRDLLLAGWVGGFVRGVCGMFGFVKMNEFLSYFWV